MTWYGLVLGLVQLCNEDVIHRRVNGESMRVRWVGRFSLLAFLSQLKGELSQLKGEIGNRTERTMPFEGQETVAVIVE